MRNKLIPCLFLLCLASVAGAVDPDTTVCPGVESYGLMSVANPWLLTGNPAGLVFNQVVLPVRTELRDFYRSGDYKRVQEGTSLNQGRFRSEAYSCLKDIRMYGRFDYENSLESGLDYSNTNNPYRDTPYDYVDTIGGDHYNREFFRLNGALSKPLGGNWAFGASCDYNVGVAVQGNDPRPENYVLDMTTAAGLIWKPGDLKVGFNLLHKYYNEEIEVRIIKDNVTMTTFRTLGLGISIDHEAGSFNRLYKRNGGGPGIQLNYSHGRFDILAGVQGIYFFEKVLDGGKGGDMSWVYLRDLSVLQGLNWELFCHVQYRNGPYRQLLDLTGEISSQLGTEKLMNLELTGELDEQDWVFYLYVPKYYALKTSASVGYSFMKMRSATDRDYGLHVSGSYLAFQEDYYIPIQHEDYANAFFTLEGYKSFHIHRVTLSLQAGLSYKLNLGGSQQFERLTVLCEKILVPDFSYYTENYIAPSLRITCEMKLNKIFSGIYLDTEMTRIVAASGRTVTAANAGIGLTF